MDILHLHLLLNHLPIVGVPIGAAMLAWGLWRRERAVQRATLGLLVIVGALAVPVFLTGEPAEERVENLAGVSEETIGRHEDVATSTMIMTGLLALVAAGGLVVSRRGRPLPRGLVLATLAGALIASSMLAATGFLGGQIRHTEIGASGAPSAPQGDESREGRRGDQ